MTHVEIETFEPKLYDGAVADEIIASIQERIADRGRCSLALAGGSTPGNIYRTLSKPPRATDVEWDKVDIFFGDERWVPEDDDQSNYRMVQETLLSQLKGKSPKVYKVETTLKSTEEGAKAYSQTIQKALSVKAGEIPIFDIVLLGIGEDGHTASLFPKSKTIHATGSICYAVQHPVNKGWRVTIGADTLFSAKKVFFIVKGESKAEMVARVIEGNDSVDDIPSRLFTTAKGEVTFLLDSGSAHNLSKKELMAQSQC